MSDRVRERFRAGELNELWGFIQVVKENGKDPDRYSEYFDHLEEVLLNYSQIKPWPFAEGNELEEIDVNFFKEEHSDFFFYFGCGMTMASLLDIKPPEVDIESRIIEICKEKYKEYRKRKNEMLRRKKLLLIDFLKAHIGENPTRNTIHEVTDLSIDSIRETIDMYCEKGILKFGKNRVILEFDADAAEKLASEK